MATQRTSTKRTRASASRNDTASASTSNAVNGTASPSASRNGTSKRPSAASASRNGTGSASTSKAVNGTSVASASRNGTSKRTSVASASRHGTSKRTSAASAHRNGATNAAKRTGAKSARRNGVGSNDVHSAVIEGLATQPGEYFFSNLSRHLAVALDVRFAFVSEVSDEPGCLTLLAFWTGDGLGEKFTYPVKGTPCERVLGKQLVSIEEGVQQAFPKDVWLGEIGAESYLAVPLLAPDGSALGHIGVIGTSPMEPSQEKVAVLQAFGTRAAGELHRDNEQRLAAQKISRVEAIVRKAAVGVVQVDSGGKIVFTNPHTERLFGYEPGELLTQPIEVLVPVSQRGRHREDRAQYLRSPHDRPMGPGLEIFGRRKDGSAIPVAVALSSDGRGAIAIITDATKAREASEKAEKSKARLEAVVEAFPEMTFIMDQEGCILERVSEGLVPHISPQGFVGKSIMEVLPEKPAARILRSVKQALRTRMVQRVKYELTWDDGVHVLEARLVRLTSERVAAFVRDFTVEEWQRDETERVGAGTTATPADEIERRMEWRNPYGLSYREFGVLYLLKGGTTDKEIAEDLGISVFTVNKHVSNILTKMSAASRTEATIRALQEGLID